MFRRKIKSALFIDFDNVVSLLTREFASSIPKWLAWLGLPIWIASLNVSILAFIGSLQWAMVLSIATTIAFVMWTVTMGLIFRMLGRHEPT